MKKARDRSDAIKCHLTYAELLKFGQSIIHGAKSNADDDDAPQSQREVIMNMIQQKTIKSKTTNKDMSLEQLFTLLEGVTTPEKEKIGKRSGIRLDGMDSDLRSVPFLIFNPITEAFGNVKIFVTDVLQFERSTQILITRDVEEFCELTKVRVDVALIKGDLLADELKCFRGKSVTMQSSLGLSPSDEKQITKKLKRFSSNNYKYDPGELDYYRQDLLKILSQPIPDHPSEINVFVRGGELVEIIDDRIQGVDEKRLKGIVCKIAKFSEGEEIVHYIPPPKILTEIIISDPLKYPLRKLAGISNSPTLRPDGTVLNRVGHDEQTGLYISAKSNVQVEDEPSHSEAKVAAETLLRPFEQFPWARDVDRSAWLSLVLTFVARHAIDGNIPMFSASANKAGSGKTKLINLAHMIAFGSTLEPTRYVNDDREQGIMLYSLLSSGVAVALFDNLSVSVGGDQLDAYLTASRYQMRKFHRQVMTPSLPTSTVLTVTGNNLRYRGDLHRRVMPINLTSSVMRPEERNFKLESIDDYVGENQNELLSAALTILRSHAVEGRPAPDTGRWGSFESWVKVIRNAIVWIGHPDPLLNREIVVGNSQSQDFLSSLALALRSVGATSKSNKTTATSLYKKANDSDGHATEELESLWDSFVATVPTNRTVSQKHFANQMSNNIDNSIESNGVKYTIRYLKANSTNGYWVESDDCLDEF